MPLGTILVFSYSSQQKHLLKRNIFQFPENAFQKFAPVARNILEWSVSQSSLHCHQLSNCRWWSSRRPTADDINSAADKVHGGDHVKNVTSGARPIEDLVFTDCHLQTDMTHQRQLHIGRDVGWFCLKTYILEASDDDLCDSSQSYLGRSHLFGCQTKSGAG